MDGRLPEPSQYAPQYLLPSAAGQITRMQFDGPDPFLATGQIMVLIGRDILARFVLIYDGSAGMFSLSF